MPATLKVKGLFFDRAVVIKAMSKATLRALSKAGAFIRTRARSSMRRRKRASTPGTPPSAHGGAQLKTLLFFSFDPSTKSVVVGPVPFARGEAPNLNEFGGQVQRKRSVVVRSGPPRKASPRQAAAFKRKVRTGQVIPKALPRKLVQQKATYPPRPFMAPALEKERHNLPARWKNSLKGN